MNINTPATAAMKQLSAIAALLNSAELDLVDDAQEQLVEWLENYWGIGADSNEWESLYSEAGWSFVGVRITLPNGSRLDLRVA